MSDCYEPIRKLLPVEAKLGFVFDNIERSVDEKKSLVFYVEGKSRFIRNAMYDGKSLILSNQSENNPMMDDGLEEGPRESSVGPAFSKKPLTPAESVTKLFNDQFRQVSGTQKVVLELLSGIEMSERTKIAVGLEAVFTKVDGWKDSTVYDRKDWELGETLILLMRDYPPITGKAELPTSKFNLGNTEYVLTESSKIVTNAHTSTIANRVVSRVWENFNRNLALCKYHPKLNIAFEKFTEASKRYLTQDL